jgi:glycine dehydrogenase subunit 1
VERHLDDTVGVVVGSSPNFLGGVEDFTALFAEAKKRGAVTVSVFQPHALMLYKTPGAMGADLAVGEGRSLGTPPSFGGPALGLFAVTGAYVRSIPGRLIGETVDRQGKRCYVMTLRTREQDIRRAKATSNICTNQSLLALRATLYASLLGPRGMREVAERCVENAHYAADRLSAAGGFRLAFEAPFFQEFALECPRPAREVVAAAESRGVLAGVDLGRFRPEWERLLLVCCNEKHRRRDLDTLVDVLSAGAGEVARV